MTSPVIISKHPAFLKIEEAFLHPEIHRLAKSIGRRLTAEGFTLLGELSYASEAYLLRSPNFSKISLKITNQILDHYHLPVVGSQHQQHEDPTVPFRDINNAHQFLNDNLPQLSKVNDNTAERKKRKKAVTHTDESRIIAAATRAFIKALANTPGGQDRPDAIRAFQEAIAKPTRFHLRKARIPVRDYPNKP